MTPGSSPRRELLGVDFQALKKQVENKVSVIYPTVMLRESYSAYQGYVVANVLNQPLFFVKFSSDSFNCSNMDFIQHFFCSFTT